MKLDIHINISTYLPRLKNIQRNAYSGLAVNILKLFTIHLVYRHIRNMISKTKTMKTSKTKPTQEVFSIFLELRHENFLFLFFLLLYNSRHSGQLSHTQTNPGGPIARPNFLDLPMYREKKIPRTLATSHSQIVNKLIRF